MRLLCVVKDAENNKNLFLYEKEKFISTIKRPGIQSIKTTHDEFKNCWNLSPSSDEVIPFTLQPNDEINYMNDEAKGYGNEHTSTMETNNKNLRNKHAAKFQI